MASTDDKIEQKIKSLKQGVIVFTEDFQDFGSAGAVKVALHRIVKKGLLHNLARGIYAKPTFSKLLNQNVLLGAEEVAIAIAKRSFVASTEHIRGIGSLGLQALKLYYDTDESREGVNALQEKRTPDFRKYVK